MPNETDTQVLPDGDTGVFNPEQIVAEVESTAKEKKKINPKLETKRRLEEMMERKKLDRQIKEFYDDDF